LNFCGFLPASTSDVYANMPSPPVSSPIIRNLTSTYIRYRGEKRGSRGNIGNLFGDDEDAQQLLRDHGAEASVEMASLPPQWVDSAEEAKEDLKTIREKLVQLTKVHQRSVNGISGSGKAYLSC